MSEKIDFKEIYKEFQPKIFYYIVEKVSRSLEGFRGQSKLSTWIYRIATNTALDKLRSPSFKRLHEQTQLEDIMDAEDGHTWTGHTETPTDQNLIRKEMSECVREFIDKLPPDYKTVGDRRNSSDLA
jgi:RNA polymerase sigma-70 factor (ECF subfamily)